jgi:hypothetical protein
MKTTHNAWLKMTAIVFLAIATLPITHMAYYQVLEWVVLAAAVQTALDAHREKREMTFWMFLAVAAVFNPFNPLQFSIPLWQTLDVTAALLFFVSLLPQRGAK